MCGDRATRFLRAIRGLYPGYRCGCGFRPRDTKKSQGRGTEMFRIRSILMPRNETGAPGDLFPSSLFPALQYCFGARQVVSGIDADGVGGGFCHVDIDSVFEQTQLF